MCEPRASSGRLLRPHLKRGKQLFRCVFGESYPDGRERLARRPVRRPSRRAGKQNDTTQSPLEVAQFVVSMLSSSRREQFKVTGAKQCLSGASTASAEGESESTDLGAPLLPEP